MTEKKKQGRPPLPKGSKLEVQYCLRVTSETGAEIEREAEAAGEENVVRFIRKLIDIGLAVTKAQRYSENIRKGQ